MNTSAKKHLAKAKDYLARGEEFYRKCAEEIIAAKEADHTLSNREIGEWFDREKSWVSKITTWSTSGDRDTPPFGGEAADARRTRHVTRKTLAEAPPEQIAELVSELEPRKQQEISRALDNASAKRQHERERASDEKLREEIGEETVDDLKMREALQSTEYLLISARGNLRGFVKQTGEIGLENTPDAWRESCLDWIEDLEGHLGMARALLAGDNIDWSAFEEMLEKEGR